MITRNDILYAVKTLTNDRKLTSVHAISELLSVPRGDVLNICQACGFDLIPGGTVGVSDDPVQNSEAGLEVRDGGKTYPFRVLKDTLVQRLKAKGKLKGLAKLLSQLPEDQQFEFDHSIWFSSESPEISGALEMLGEDPKEILAFDPLAVSLTGRRHG
jgi:hypothetical protein